MASCRSRRTGNCSDYSKNKHLQEKAPETFPESFPTPRSPALCGSPRVGEVIAHGSGVIPERQIHFVAVDAVSGPGWHNKKAGH